MLRVLTAVMLAFVLVGCSGEGGDDHAGHSHDESDTGARTMTEAPEGESRSAITANLPEADVTVGMTMTPFFDQEGSAGSKAVAPGETFDIHVWVSQTPGIATNAAQMRLVIPTGIRVLGVEKIGQQLTMGDIQENYQIAYPCNENERFGLFKVAAIVEESFQGGEIEIGRGILPNGESFLGFVDCRKREMLAGSGGKATLTRR